MKRRSALRRRTPLRNRTGIKRTGSAKRMTTLRRKTPLRSRSPRQAKRQRQWNAITKAKLEAGGRCVDGPEGCQGPIDGDHIMRAGRGGSWTKENHALRCRRHHDIRHGKRKPHE